jgi:hypothetical protein
MRLFVRAVVTGFGLSLGSALYKKLAKRFGFEDEEPAKAPPADVAKQDGATDPGLQRQN